RSTGISISATPANPTRSAASTLVRLAAWCVVEICIACPLSSVGRSGGEPGGRGRASLCCDPGDGCRPHGSLRRGGREDVKAEVVLREEDRAGESHRLALESQHGRRVAECGYERLHLGSGPARDVPLDYIRRRVPCAC